MEPLPYYKWHWRDYRANRRVQRMSWQAKGLYRELLDEFWAEGFLPVDHEELAIICGCTLEEFEEHWPEIKGCWEETPDGLINAKMDSQRTVTDSKRVTNAKNGSAGARAKLANASDSLANAKPSPANAKQTPSERHIEEKRREEKSKEEQKPSRDKREGDPRHVPFKDEIQRYMTQKQVLFIWDASEAKALDLLLKATPGLTIADFQRCLFHRARSPGTPHGDRPRVWLPNILKYQEAPLNEFGKTGVSNGNRNSKTGGNVDSAKQALAILAEAERASGVTDEVQPSEAGSDEPGDFSHLRAGSIELQPD